MGDQRTPEQEKLYQQGRADAFAEASKKHSAEAKDEVPAHLRENYSGPLTGDQAQEIHAQRAAAEKAKVKAAKANETKPATVQATK